MVELSAEMRHLHWMIRKPVSSSGLLLYMQTEFIPLCTFVVYYFDACKYTETVSVFLSHTGDWLILVNIKWLYSVYTLTEYLTVTVALMRSSTVLHLRY